uniref:WGS project CBMI000000000 data, contig CS3069_c004718 n=1 Tax=Fusarium clavum TaxID=2594811 RepID=A0A090N641_9HYPO|nr:unnamed protein product [Fusarium clavum]CEG05985.1 unnamed protein product [Fusarium clavum]
MLSLSKDKHRAACAHHTDVKTLKRHGSDENHLMEASLKETSYYPGAERTSTANFPLIRDKFNVCRFATYRRAGYHGISRKRWTTAHRPGAYACISKAIRSITMVGRVVLGLLFVP